MLKHQMLNQINELERFNGLVKKFKKPNLHVLFGLQNIWS